MGGMFKNVLNKIINTIFSGGSIMPDKAQVKICYEGQLHQIDVDTLLISLLHFAEITKNISKEISPGEHIQIKINPAEKGSFIINLELIRNVVGLFKPDNINSLATVLEAIVNILHIKQFLKGKKPDKTEQKNGTIIILNSGAQLVVADKVFQVYSKNHDINEHINGLFNNLSEAPEIEGLSIDAGDLGFFHAHRSDFNGLAQENELLKEEEEVDIIHTELSVVKVVFQRKRKWEFIYQGNKISALVEDEDFWRQIDSGIRFGKGDILVVDLEITKVFDNEVHCFINKSFKVLRVYERRPPSSVHEQLKFPAN